MIWWFISVPMWLGFAFLLCLSLAFGRETIRAGMRDDMDIAFPGLFITFATLSACSGSLWAAAKIVGLI